MTNILEVRHLTKTFPSVRAVDDVSFNVKAGSIFGFIGPNGAGKTTTMRILATLDSATSGDVLVRGTSLLDDPDIVRGAVGFMPDYYGTYPGMSVVDYIDFFGRAYGLRGKRLKDTVERLIDFTDMDGIREKLVSTLSKGMKQRLALARTLVHDPELLILDEPAAGLDPRARVVFRELLKVLAEQGKAIVISSHILTELSELVDACAIIERGRIVCQGTVDEVREQARAVTSAASILKIELLDDHPQVESRLREQPFVEGVRMDGRRIAVDFRGDGAAVARLLKALVGANVPIISFHTETADLEDVFMAVTRGEVQ